MDNGSIYTKNLVNFLSEKKIKFVSQKFDEINLSDIQQFNLFILSGRKKNDRKINAVNSKSKRSKTITKVISDGKVAYQQRLKEMKNSIGVKIDSNVTSDIHRIFRLEGSLNSKSGLVKLVCDNIEKFNPYTEACLIDDEPVEILANLPTEFRLKDGKFGPYAGEKVSIPRYAAVYMLCKGIANLA